jgi:hypothetical protein
MPESNESSAAFYRGAVFGIELMTQGQGVGEALRRYRTLLAVAEAREATQPTAAEVIESAEKALKRVVGLDYMGDPDVAIHSFPNLKVTPMQAAEELYELRSIIARWKEANG